MKLLGIHAEVSDALQLAKFVRENPISQETLDQSKKAKG